ncbi:unnamed protein product, partial [Thlaspi arvense]
PGCSSVGYGATEEIGPFLADTNEKGLIFNPYAWNKGKFCIGQHAVFRISRRRWLFVFKHESSDYINLDDNFATRDAYTFLCNWFEKFSEYRGNEFSISQAKAMQLGNPETSIVEDWRGWVDYAWSHAVISDETYRIISKSCNFSSDDYWGDKCHEAITEVEKQYNEIDVFSLYTSVCRGDNAQSSYFESAQFKTNSHISSNRVRVLYN